MWNCFLGLCSLQTFPPNFLSFPCILGLETLTHSHVKSRAGSQEWHEGQTGLPSRWPCSGGSGWAEPSKRVPSQRPADAGTALGVPAALPSVLPEGNLLCSPPPRHELFPCTRACLRGFRWKGGPFLEA